MLSKGEMSIAESESHFASLELARRNLQAKIAQKDKSVIETLFFIAGILGVTSILGLFYYFTLVLILCSKTLIAFSLFK